MEFKNFHNYLVYEDGTVYSTTTNRILKPDINHGYCMVKLYINSKPFRIKVHRLVATLWLECPRTKKAMINHKDGNKMNIIITPIWNGVQRMRITNMHEIWD